MSAQPRTVVPGMPPAVSAAARAGATGRAREPVTGSRRGAVSHAMLKKPGSRGIGGSPESESAP